MISHLAALLRRHGAMRVNGMVRLPDGDEMSPAEFEAWALALEGRDVRQAIGGQYPDRSGE